VQIVFLAVVAAATLAVGSAADRFVDLDRSVLAIVQKALSPRRQRANNPAASES
jgi:hypothetical protein